MALNSMLFRSMKESQAAYRRTVGRASLRRSAALRSGDADGLLVLKLDRLSRSTRDVLDVVALAALSEMEFPYTRSSAHENQ